MSNTPKVDEINIDSILDTITEGGSFISQKEFLILIVEPMVSVHEDDGEIVKYSTPENPMKLRKEKTKEALYQLFLEVIGEDEDVLEEMYIEWDEDDHRKFYQNKLRQTQRQRANDLFKGDKDV